MDSRLEGYLKRWRSGVSQARERPKMDWRFWALQSDLLGACAKPPVQNQCDSRWWFYACPLNRDHGLYAQRAVSYEEYTTHQRAQDYWSVHRELWFYDAYNHGATWYKRTYGLQISTHVYIHGLHYIWDIKYALCTDICQSICQSICRHI